MQPSPIRRSVNKESPMKSPGHSVRGGSTSARGASASSGSDRPHKEGIAFEVPRERIRSIEAKALRKLRHPERSRRLEEFINDRPHAPARPPYLNGTFLWTGLGYRYAMTLPPDRGSRAAKTCKNPS